MLTKPIDGKVNFCQFEARGCERELEEMVLARGRVLAHADRLWVGGLRMLVLPSCQRSYETTPGCIPSIISKVFKAWSVGRAHPVMHSENSGTPAMFVSRVPLWRDYSAITFSQPLTSCSRTANSHVQRRLRTDIRPAEPRSRILY